MSKPKLAIYWAASCGGCDIAILDIEAKILDVAAAFDLALWPCAADFKRKDVEAMPEGGIDLCLFNGGIRTSENEEMAKLLRSRSKVLVAFGSCAQEGGIPGLANQFTHDALFARVYRESPSTDNAAGVLPVAHTAVAEGDLELPVIRDSLKKLDQVVDVDYYIPGCPPQPTQIWAVLETIVQGKPLPPKGAVLGAGEKTCCDECPRTREEKKIRHFVRPHEIVPDPHKCLLEQGIVCIGPATRSGCGALCVGVGVPCRGCYGPPPGTRDQGAKMISAIASVIDSQDPQEIEAIVAEIADPVGTFHRFSLASSMIKGAGS
jgi:F420-non-reducing hydrogenase small subunit